MKPIHQSRHPFLHRPSLPIAALLLSLLLPHQRPEGFPDNTTDLLLLLGRTGLEGLGEKQLQQFENQPHNEKYAKNGDHVHSPHQFQHPTRILQSIHPHSPSHIHKAAQTPSPVRSCNNLMLGLFFEKSEKVSFLPGGSFQRVSNNLDSQYYVLQRVKGAKQDYIPQQYFDTPHPQLLEYFTAWQEKQLVQQEEAPAAKKPKEKKGIGGLLSKKSMTERVPGKSLKQTKEELPVMVEEEVLYVQLESFSEVDFPSQETEARQFMALIYLLAMRVYERFNCWPQMLPVITESKHYKFVKRGLKAQLELARLFEYVYKQEKMNALGSWAPAVAASMMELDSQEERKGLLGTFLKQQLEVILQGDFSIKVRKGQQCQVVTVVIEDAFTLVLKELNLQLSIEEYEISYYHQDSQTRQIIMEHSTQPAIVLQGNRSNLIIKYLKQFVIA